MSKSKGKGGYVVAVVGATGVVGQEMIKVLEERKFPVSRLIPMASERSKGKKVKFRGKKISVVPAKPSAFSGVDIALFSAGSAISERLVPEAARRDVVSIDNTSFFRMQPGVPLVVPEVNADAIGADDLIIANPNCSTAQMVLVLKPIHDAARIKRIVVSTYQSASGAGKDAMEELKEQSGAVLRGKRAKPKVFTKQIAFNVIPHIDRFLPNGYTREEVKMVEETRKILADPSIAITATTVRVPVMIGHSEAVNIETERKITAEEVRQKLSAFPTVKVVDDPSRNVYPTPVDAVGSDDTYVGRIREDISKKNGIDLWIVSDNLRRGAATNAVLIAERVILFRKPKG